MNRIDGYLMALENNTLDEYYEKKKYPMRKLSKFTKGQRHGTGQAKATDKACTKHGDMRRNK